MKKKEAIKQLDKSWKNMKKPVKAFLNSGDQEELHQFRVQVKKLEAMLTLYANEPKNANLLKEFRPVKEVFKKAGDIRNAYINLKLGEKHQLNNLHFNQHQQKILDQNIEKFKIKGGKYFKVLKKAHVVLQNDVHRLHQKTIRKFYQDKLKKVDAFFAKPAFDQTLHNARKNIKLLLYNQKLAAPALANKVQINLIYLDGLQELIGQWHDHNLAIEVLADTGKAENQAIDTIKNSNADLERAIAERGFNFKEKVSAAELETVKI